MSNIICQTLNKYSTVFEVEVKFDILTQESIVTNSHGQTLRAGCLRDSIFESFRFGSIIGLPLDRHT